MAESNYKSHDKLVEVYQKAKQKIDGYRKELKEEDQRRHILYDVLDKQLPEWRELLGFGKPLTEEEKIKVRQLLEQLKNAPDNDDYYDND